MEAVRIHQTLRGADALNAGMDRYRLLFKDVQARFNVRSGRVQCRFKLGSNFWRADQGHFAEHFSLLPKAGGPRYT